MTITGIQPDPAADMRARAAAIRDGSHWTSPGTVPAAYKPQPVPARVAVREPGTVAPADDGAGIAVLELVSAYLDHYVSWPSETDRWLVTLWVAHAVARDRDDSGIGPLIWRATPRLLLTSKVRGSGKSTVLDLLAILTRVSGGKEAKITPAAIAKRLGRKHEAAILDEAKLMFGSGQRSADLQGVLLTGYTRRSSYTISVGQKDVSISVFGPVAYAGKDELITDTGGLLGDLLDRTITIRMRKPTRYMPEVDEVAEDEGDQLADALIQWTDLAKDRMRAAARTLAASDRAEAEAVQAAGGAAKDNFRMTQISRPLRAVAATAGGPWPERITAALRAGGPEGELQAKLDALAERIGKLSAPAAANQDDDDWGDDL